VQEETRADRAFDGGVGRDGHDDGRPSDRGSGAAEDLAGWETRVLVTGRPALGRGLDAPRGF